MKRYFTIHPFLFGLFPILFLWGRNYQETSVGPVIGWATATVILVALFSLFLTRILRDKLQAGLWTTVFLAAFFSYGHVFILTQNLFRLPGLRVGEIRNRFFFSAYILIVLLLIVVIFKTKGKLLSVTKILNRTAFALFALAFLHLSFLSLGIKINLFSHFGGTKPTVLKAGQIHMEPDIYYVILDGYGNLENLRKIFNFDNGPFINNLKDKGFTIIPDARSNYTTSVLSIFSSLNMNYADNLLEEKENDFGKGKELYREIDGNAVMSKLKSKGYKIINYSSGWGPTNYISFADKNVDCGASFSEFSLMLVKTTMLRVLEFSTGIFQYSVNKRKRVVSTFDRLMEEKRNPEGPKFVFAHIAAPHPPYVFDPNESSGIRSVISDNPHDWTDKDGYDKEIEYLNKKVLELVEVKLGDPTNAPVIIIQGDHGPASTLSDILKSEEPWINPTIQNMSERTGILNAIYLPEKCRPSLYRGMTPVNSFRLIFNCLFDSGYEILRDEIYWSSPNDMFNLRRVTRKLRDKSPG